MNSYNSRRSRSQRDSAKPSLIGMIRARKLAIKIKRRAQFLVADKRRRENCGKTILIHHDIPQPSSRKSPNLNDERFLTLNEGRPVVSSRPYLASRDTESKRNPGECKTTPDRIFPVLAIESKIEEILESRLKGVKYSPVLCKEISKSLAEEIKKEVQKSYELKRYKLISVVNIGEIKISSVCTARFGSRCLWNTMFDNFASSSYKNSQVFAVATLYAVYYD